MVVGYPLSCPPVWNLAMISGRSTHAVECLYYPLTFAIEQLPPPVQDYWNWYFYEWSWIYDLNNEVDENAIETA